MPFIRHLGARCSHTTIWRYHRNIKKTMSSTTTSARSKTSKQSIASTQSIASAQAPAKAPEQASAVAPPIQPDSTSTTTRPPPKRVDPRIKDFGEEMLARIMCVLQSRGWIYISIISLLLMLAQNDFQTAMIQMLEILLLEIDENYDLYHAEKDFVCIGTNISQIIAAMLFGENREIYVKFNGLKLLRKASVIVGQAKKAKENIDIYTLDSSKIDLYDVDLLQVYPDDGRHVMTKLLKNQKLPFKLHLKFCNNQSMVKPSNPRYNAQQTIINKFVQNIEKFLFTTLMSSISTYNVKDRNEGVAQPEVDMTHEVIFDYILENLYDLKTVYCYLFRHLRLGFVKVSDLRMSKKEACYTIDGEDYFLVCYSYADSLYKASTSNGEYRMKMKNFMKAENINYNPDDLNEGVGKADVTPDGLFYRVATLNKNTSPKIENFVTKDLSFENPVLNLRDQSDLLNPFYGFPENLKVEFGCKTLQVKLQDMEFFENKYTEQEKASITYPGFKLNCFNYVSYDKALKYILRFNNKAYRNVVTNIDVSKIEEQCKDALKQMNQFTLFDYARCNLLSIITTKFTYKLEIEEAADCMAENLINDDQERYTEDLSTVIDSKNIIEVSEALKNVSTKLYEDYGKLDSKMDKIPGIKVDFATQSFNRAIEAYKVENKTFVEKDFKNYIKSYLLSDWMYKEEVSYNFFSTIDGKLFKTFKINSKSKLEDYQREFSSLMKTDRVAFDETIDNITSFFEFKNKFTKNNGYDKLFKKLIYD